MDLREPQRTVDPNRLAVAFAASRPGVPSRYAGRVRARSVPPSGFLRYDAALAILLGLRPRRWVALGRQRARRATRFAHAVGRRGRSSRSSLLSSYSSCGRSPHGSPRSPYPSSSSPAFSSSSYTIPLSVFERPKAPRPNGNPLGPLSPTATPSSAKSAISSSTSWTERP